MIKKGIGLLVSFLLIISTVTGCNRQGGSESSPLRVVTAVSVFYSNGPINAQRHYTSDAKMQKILDYLRLINPYGTPDEDPETAVGSDFHIVLSYSDGYQKFYRQKSDRYLQNTDGRWQKIDPTKAEELARLVGQLESDAVL